MGRETERYALRTTTRDHPPDQHHDAEQWDEEKKVRNLQIKTDALLST
jgi:hypothetical protein